MKYIVIIGAVFWCGSRGIVGPICWGRVSQNWAGAGWGHLAIPRVGQEVIVSCLDGDPDQPIITGRTYRETNPPPYELPRHKTISTILSKEIRSNRASELSLDDTPGQISAALMNDHGTSALHLGYLTHPRTKTLHKPRGEGAELRSDHAVAIRGGKGLLLTTEAQLQAQGGQLQRDGLVEGLEAALTLSGALDDVSTKHQGINQQRNPRTSLIQAVTALGSGQSGEFEGNKGLIAESMLICLI